MDSQDPAESVKDRTSTLFGCAAGVYDRKTSTYRSDSAEIRMEVLKHKYDYLPPTCTRYSYGDNPYHSCKNCRHAISSPTDGSITITRNVVGCVAKNINADYLIAVKAAGSSANSSLERISELHAHDCSKAVMPHETPSVFDTLDDQIVETPTPTSSRKLFKWEALQSPDSTIRNSEYESLVEAYRKTGCSIYRRLLLKTNNGEKLSDGQARVLYSLRKNRDRIDRQEEFKSRLERIIKRKATTDLMRYLELVENYGYLTPQQEKRLSGAEKTL